MKHFLKVICALSLVSVSANAQVGVGPCIGANVTKFRLDGSPLKEDKLVINMRLGVLFDIALKRHWHLQPGLVYTSNTEKYDVQSATSSIKVNSIELPIGIIYKIRQKNGANFFWGIAPYVGLNINGVAKAVYTDYVGTVVSTGKYDIPIANGQIGCFRRFGAGVGANIGYEFKKGISIRGYGQKLLTDLYAKPGPGKRLSFFNYGIAFAYQIHRNKKHTNKEIK